MSEAESVTLGPPLTGRKRWVALLFLSLGVAMIILDATVVNVAIPTIVRDLGLSTTDAEWVNAIYSLTFASLLLLAGRLSDVFGRRLLFVVGVTVFTVASLFVALSDGSTMLIASRALQGIGASMILPASLSVLNAVYRGRDRSIAFAVWGATIGGMAALGPLVGGWLTTDVTWHWAFLINVPIGIAVVIGVLLLVPETKDIGDKTGVDLPGTILGTLGLAGLVFGLIEGQKYGWVMAKSQFTFGSFTWTWSLSPAFVGLVIGVVLLLLFLLVQKRRLDAGKVVLVDLRLFRINTFATGNLVAAIVSLGEFGLLFALPLFLQSAVGYSALQTGVVLIALAVGSFAASGAGAGLARKIGPVMVLRIGMLLEVIGVLLLTFSLSPTVGAWAMVPGLFVYGLGVGFATAQLTGVILADVPVAESGQASAVQSTSRQVGAAIGTALLGATLLAGLSAVQTELTGAGVPVAEAEYVTEAVKDSAGTAVAGLHAQPNGDVVFNAAAEGFATATKYVGFVAAGLIGLGFVASLFLPRNAARTEAAGYGPEGREAAAES